LKHELDTPNRETIADDSHTQDKVTTSFCVVQWCQLVDRCENTLEVVDYLSETILILQMCILL